MVNKLFISIFAVLIISGVVFADQFRTIRSNGKLELSHKPAYTVVSLAANTVTPNVLLGTVFITGINSGSTAITGFSNVEIGNIITVVGNASTTVNATTIADSGAFKLNGAFTASANHSIRVFVRGSGDYVELCRSAN